MANKRLKTLTIDGTTMDVNIAPQNQVYSNNISNTMTAFTRDVIGTYTIQQTGIYLIDVHGDGDAGSYTGNASFGAGAQIGSDNRSQSTTGPGNATVTSSIMRIVDVTVTPVTMTAYLIGSLGRTVQGNVRVIRLDSFT